MKTEFTGFVCSECSDQLETGVRLPVNEHQITVAPCDKCYKEVRHALQYAWDAGYFAHKDYQATAVIKLVKKALGIK